MEIHCPYCHFLILLTGVKPGRFTPACARCKKRFVLKVYADSPPKVQPLDETLQHKVEEALAHAPHPGGAAPAEHTTGAAAPGGIAANAGAGAHVAAPAARPAPSSVSETAAPTPSQAAEDAEVEKFGGEAVSVPADEHAIANASTVTGVPVSEVIDSSSASDIAGQLGGYVIERKLGQGGMGAVYLARQVSLNRPVAVKVMNAQWAKDPTYVARFTREAYAAAQLSHHNVVQIHDIGVEGKTHFFSMEYVPGKNLSSLVRAEGVVDPELAVGLTLQAARGLKFAHEHGMVHRDVKPENLLLNNEGIVKVADLGLVKTPGAEKLTAPMGGAANTGQTQVNVSMGTPAYMSPEQARDAANVDQRADVYSLGCTLYDLVTGRPPFEGKSAVEVLSKHASEPVTPPDVVVKRIPKTLSNIIQKMIAKDPKDRYDSMASVIRALETYMGVKDTGTFSPHREQTDLLEKNVALFDGASWARLRRQLVLAFLVLIPLGAVASALWYSWLLAGGLLGFGLITVASYQAVVGITQKTYLFSRLRAVMFGARIADWFKAIVGIAFGVMLLWLFGLLWVWVGFAVLAVGLAVAFHVVIDGLVARQRRAALAEVNDMLKMLRLKGLAEDAVRHFVCRHSGQRWEEFFEALFGYESKMEARTAWGKGAGGRPRPKYGAWRDPVTAWAEAKLRARQEAREKKTLEDIEAKGLEAAGADEVSARRKAKDRAEAFVMKAAVIRDERKRRAAATAGPASVVSFSETSDEEAASLRRERARRAAARTFGGKYGVMLLGPHIRLVLGALLLGACLLWMKQNNLLHPEKVREFLYEHHRRLAEPWRGPQTTDQKLADVDKVARGETKALDVPFVPLEWREKALNSLAPGLAGLALVLASMWRGVKISLLVIPAAAIMVAGPLFGVPAITGFSTVMVSCAAGGVLAMLGFWFGREIT